MSGRPDDSAPWYVKDERERHPEGSEMTDSEQERLQPSAALLRLAARAAASEELQQVVVERRTPPVAAGQLWRATWADASVLVLIVGLADDPQGRPDALACPVTSAANDSAEASLPATAGLCDQVQLHDGDSHLLWHTLTTRLPFAVLDICLDEAAVEAHQLRRAEPARTPQARHELLEQLDPFAPYIDELAQLLDDLEQLEAAPRLQARTDMDDEPSLAATLSGTGAQKIRTLMQVLGVNQADAMAVLRGSRPLSDEDADRLAAHLPAGAATTRSAGFPTRLVATLEEPRWRDAVRAHTRGGDELAARREIAAGVATMAARDSSNEPNWNERIDRWLQAQT